jgi:hypothetical protein
LLFLLAGQSVHPDFFRISRQPNFYFPFRENEESLELAPKIVEV